MSRVIAVMPAASGALVGASAPSGAARSATCPHSGTIDGMSVLVACGPAKAGTLSGADTLAAGTTKVAVSGSFTC
jgi:hypothetical protein